MKIDNLYYYYYRDDEGRPLVTVCLMEMNGVYARGIAICSPLDNPVKETGRRIARRRAYEAIFNEIDDYEVGRDEAYIVLENAVAPVFDVKSEFAPSLNAIEKRILDIDEDKKSSFTDDIWSDKWVN